jgi:IQ calmodulin-binding motif
MCVLEGFEQHRAATIIQALWRGYCARQKNAHIQAVRHELRTRRLEDHLRFLRLELDR